MTRRSWRPTDKFYENLSYGAPRKGQPPPRRRQRRILLETQKISFRISCLYPKLYIFGER